MPTFAINVRGFQELDRRIGQQYPYDVGSKGCLSGEYDAVTTYTAARTENDGNCRKIPSYDAEQPLEVVVPTDGVLVNLNHQICLEPQCQTHTHH